MTLSLEDTVRALLVDLREIKKGNPVDLRKAIAMCVKSLEAVAKSGDYVIKKSDWDEMVHENHILTQQNLRMAISLTQTKELLESHEAVLGKLQLETTKSLKEISL